MAKHTLGSFATRLRNGAAKIPQNVKSIRDEVVLSVHNTLVEVTPVDDGDAKTNWRVYPAPTDGEVIPTPASIAEGEAAARAQAIGSVTATAPGLPVYIINRVPYIMKLNNGSSRQAPANFVRISIELTAEVLRKRRKIVLEIK